MAAVISNQGGFYSTFAYVSEARRSGLRIRPPDVNLSDIKWTGRSTGAAQQSKTVSKPATGHGTLRVGLMAVKDLNEATAQHIIEKRSGRPYADLHDFLVRAEPDEEDARALILCGACDALRPGTDRTVLLWELAAWKHHRRGRKARKKQTSAPMLFEEPSTPIRTDLPELPPGTELERLRQEFTVLGFLCDRHPMVLYQKQLRKHRPIKAESLSQHVGQRITCAGWLITGKVVSTRKGEPMEFLTFEDETGTIETTFFPDAYRRHWDQLQSHTPCVFHGLVEEDFGALTVTVERLEKLGPAN